jgi:hypothetical protein
VKEEGEEVKGRKRAAGNYDVIIFHTGFGINRDVIVFLLLFRQPGLLSL